MSLVSRPYYLDFLRRHKDRPIIKVVSGIRRCGKSTLFKLFQDELLADNVTAEQIIDINFELMEYMNILMNGLFQVKKCIYSSMKFSMYHRLSV